ISITEFIRTRTTRLRGPRCMATGASFIPAWGMIASNIRIQMLEKCILRRCHGGALKFGGTSFEFVGFLILAEFPQFRCIRGEQRRDLRTIVAELLLRNSQRVRVTWLGLLWLVPFVIQTAERP